MSEWVNVKPAGPFGCSTSEMGVVDVDVEEDREGVKLAGP